MLRQFFKGIPADLRRRSHRRRRRVPDLLGDHVAVGEAGVDRGCGLFDPLHLARFLRPAHLPAGPPSYPLSLGLFAFRSQRSMEWALIMTASTLTELPLILVFLFTQRYFIRGVAMTGLKG